MRAGKAAVPGRSRSENDLTVISRTHRRPTDDAPECWRQTWTRTPFNALHHSQVIDLTTTGRRTRPPRKIEIFLHDKDGLLFISGMPRSDRTRDWIHNITADPQVVVHLKQRTAVDIPATARVVTDPADRRPFDGSPSSALGPN